MKAELERRAFLKAAAAACVAVRTPCALAAWCSPSKMKEMESDEEGGKARYDDPSLDWMYVNNFRKWDALAARGAFVMMGEFGVYNKTPHDVALRWMEDNLRRWKEKGIGWALWNFRGSFGILDSDRTDVQYENFKGHKLDRKMLELLQRY